MIFELRRFAFLKNCTFGVLKQDSQPRWFTLEDPDRLMVSLPKIMERTAIPAGIYPIKIKNWSPKFKRSLPEILNVPGFSDILIHIGNDHTNTSGCCLVGMRASIIAERIYESSTAFEQVYKAMAVGENILAVTREEPSPSEMERLKRIWTVEALA